jgi:hypothetical protein
MTKALVDYQQQSTPNPHGFQTERGLAVRGARLKSAKPTPPAATMPPAAHVFGHSFGLWLCLQAFWGRCCVATASMS